MSPAERRPLLEVAGLNAFYGKSQVVFDLDLTIARGEVVTLLGRNGAGKTSTLLGIAGVDHGPGGGAHRGRARPHRICRPSSAFAPASRWSRPDRAPFPT